MPVMERVEWDQNPEGFLNFTLAKFVCRACGFWEEMYCMRGSNPPEGTECPRCRKRVKH